MKNMNILVITKNWIGDVIFAEPLMRLVKKQFPESKLTVMTTPRCRAFLQKYPIIDEIICFDEKGAERSWFARIRFIFRLRRLHINRVYVLHRSFSRVLLCCAAGIPERIGYDTKHRGKLLTTAVATPAQSTAPEHDVERFLRLLPADTIPAPERKYRFYFDAQDTAQVRDALQQQGVIPGRCFALNPGANWLPKRWPAAHFAVLAELLYKTYTLPIIITGNSDNETLAREILAAVRHRACVSFCGKTTISELGALFAQCKCVVTADSGPMHIAAGVGTPVVAIFGPTDELRTGPYGIGRSTIVSCRDPRCVIPCYDTQCTHARCMEQVTPEMVYAAIVQLLQEA